MITDVVYSRESRGGHAFIEQRERWILPLVLVGYAALSYFLWAAFEVHFDAPAYTDPAASYVMGQGFTSGCWYFQGPGEFWAGNVPLHSALLIPWFKVFGFSADSVWALNMLYVLAGLGLLWRSMVKTGVVPSAPWRLGAVVFFLATRSCLSLVMSRRPDALGFLILCAAWWVLTLERPGWRRLAMAGCGFLAVWGSLSLAVFFAFAGMGAVLFYGKRYFKETAALAAGGALGAAALCGFYGGLGVLEVFLLNLSPHTGLFHGSEVVLSQEFEGFVDGLHSWRGRLAGLMDLSACLVIGLSVWVAAMAWRNGRSRRLAALNLACAMGVPAGLALTGVFAAYYAFLVTVPVTVMLFGLLAGGVIRDQRGWGAIRAVLWLSAIVPGSYLWCSAVQAAPSLQSKQHERMSAFVKEVIRPDDVVWVEPRFWFAAKPVARQVFSGLWRFQARSGQGAEAMTVAIDYGVPQVVPLLPGRWEPTGEVLRVPDFHRFYRVGRNGEAGEFRVFRRMDRP